MERPVLVLNRGGGSAGEGAEDKVRSTLDAQGIDAEIVTVSGGEAAKAAEKALADGARTIIAAGGDGTISAVAGALANSKAVLGILPLGTLNHFARDLSIPFDPAEAAAVLAAGTRHQVDLAEMNGRVFINNSAIGLYPLMVIDREGQRQRLGRSKKLAMIIASVRTLARFHHHRLTLTVNDQKELVDTPLLFVGNNEYRIGLRGAGTRESLSDGKLCVYVMRNKGATGLIAAAIRALFNRAREDDMVQIEGVQRLRVESRRSHLTVSLDGEVVSARTPIEYRILPKALTVIAP
jgi:YegS/Rv2252/BmrU family lipid kinase